MTDTREARLWEASAHPVDCGPHIVFRPILETSNQTAKPRWTGLADAATIEGQRRYSVTRKRAKKMFVPGSTDAAASREDCGHSRHWMDIRFVHKRAEWKAIERRESNSFDDDVVVFI